MMNNEESNPLISVLIPSYNHASFIKETIHSIWNQNYNNIEIIITDDRSTDNTVEILNELKQSTPFPMYIIVNEKQLGIAGNCNAAISHAKGKFVCFLASDDMLMPNRFDKQIDFFKKNENLKILINNGYVYEGTITSELVHRNKAATLFKKNAVEIAEYLQTNSIPLFIQAILIRTDFLREVGGFDETVIADDWLLFTRIFDYIAKNGGDFLFYDEPVFLYRVHSTNIHKDFERQSRLKIDFIENVTPLHLKRKASANIYSKLAIQAISLLRFNDGISFYVKSQRAKFNIFYTVKFIKKLLSTYLISFFKKRNDTK